MFVCSFARGNNMRSNSIPPIIIKQTSGSTVVLPHAWWICLFIIVSSGNRIYVLELRTTNGEFDQSALKIYCKIQYEKIVYCNELLELLVYIDLKRKTFHQNSKWINMTREHKHLINCLLFSQSSTAWKSNKIGKSLYKIEQTILLTTTIIMSHCLLIC